MKIVIASNNINKSRELKDILTKEDVDTVLQSELNIDSVEETGLTFVENAILKARHASKCAKMPAIADDSGILVEALIDEPGIYSARYAGESATDKENVEKLLEMIKDIPEDKRIAKFQCAMVFLRTPKDPSPIICQGTWKGKITFAPKGERGFGYDPIFFVPEENCTSAEIDPDIKNKISHRAQALQKLVLSLKGEGCL